MKKLLCDDFQTLLALDIEGIASSKYINFSDSFSWLNALFFFYQCYLWANSFAVISKDSFLCIKRILLVVGSKKLDIYIYIYIYINIYNFLYFFRRLIFPFSSSSTVSSERIHMWSFVNTPCFVYLRYHWEQGRSIFPYPRTLLFQTHENSELMYYKCIPRCIFVYFELIFKAPKYLKFLLFEIKFRNL